MTTQRMHLIQNQIGGMESMPTVIIGGGQAGLVMGYHLQKVGEQFLILDAQPRIGDSWRNRWDSLRLFSTPRYSSLPGWPMRLSTWPTHIEMGDYLEDYARHFDLPVRSGVRVNPSPTALNPERNFSRVPARQPCLVTGPDRLQSNLCSRASRAHDKYGSTELLWVSVGIRMQLPDPGCQLGCEVWNDWSLVATRGNDDSLRPQHTVRGLQSKA
jgi:hypothetical protein